MRTMIIAAVAAMGLASGAAHADGGRDLPPILYSPRSPAWSPGCRQGMFRRSILRSRQARSTTGQAIAAGCLPRSSPCRAWLGIEGRCLLLQLSTISSYNPGRLSNVGRAYT